LVGQGRHGTSRYGAAWLGPVRRGEAGMANALMRERGGDDPMRKQRAEWAPGYRVKVSADTAHSEFE